MNLFSRIFVGMFAGLLAASPLSALAQVDAELSQRLSGHVLLSVEERGELWYVIPETQERVYMGTTEYTWQVIKGQIIGITDADLARIETDTELRDRLTGRFLLAVESNGEAYYVRPQDKQVYYIGTGATTFENLKGLALGITSANLNLIAVDQSNATSPVVEDEVVEPIVVEYTDAQMGWDFASQLWAGYEAFAAQTSDYPSLSYFESLIPFNTTIYLNESGFQLDAGQSTYFAWSDVSAEFKVMYFDHIRLVREGANAMLAFYLPSGVQTADHGYLQAGNYYFTSNTGLLDQAAYEQSQWYAFENPGQTPANPTNFYTDGQLGYDFVAELYTGYEAFYQDHGHYPDVQYFDDNLQYGLPIYLNENGFTLASGEDDYFYWDNFSLAWQDMYNNAFSFYVDPTNQRALLSVELPSVAVMDNGKLVEAGEIHFASNQGFLDEEAYQASVWSKIQNPAADAGRIIEQVRAIQTALEIYKRESYGFYPLTPNGSVELGEYGAVQLSYGRGFWGGDENTQAYLSNIESGFPTTKLVFEAPAYGRGYTLEFTIYGEYDGFTPGHYVARPGTIEKVADL